MEAPDPRGNVAPRERCSTCRHWGTPDAAGAAVCALDELKLPRTAESSCTLWEARCEVIGAGVVLTGNVIQSRGDP